MEKNEKYTEQSSMMNTISEDMLESVNGGKSEFGIDSGVKGCSFTIGTWDCPACGRTNPNETYTCLRCGAPEPR